MKKNIIDIKSLFKNVADLSGVSEDTVSLIFNNLINEIKFNLFNFTDIKIKWFMKLYFKDSVARKIYNTKYKIFIPVPKRKVLKVELSQMIHNEIRTLEKINRTNKNKKN